MSDTANEGVKRIKNNYFDGMPISRKQLFIMFVMIAGCFFEQIDNQLTSFVGPNVMASLHIGTSDWALMNTVTLVGMFCGGFIGGYLSDRWGRKKVFLGSLTVVTAMAMGCGFVSYFPFFLVFRLFQGIGVMSMTVTFVTYLLEITPAEQRGKWEGICAGVGYVAIPVIGAVATWALPLDANAWRWLFWLSAGGVIPLVVGIAVMPESPRWLISRGEVAKAEASVECLIHVPVDLSDVRAEYIVDADRRRSLRGFDALRVLFGPGHRKRFIVLLVVCIAQTCPFALMTQWNNIALQGMGLPQQASLAITAVGTLGAPLGCLLGAWLGPKGGRRKAIAVSFGLEIAAFLLYVFAAADASHNLVALGALYLGCLVFANCALICCNPYYGESLPTSVRNFGSGFVHSTSRLVTAGVMGLVPALMVTAGILGIGVLSVGMVVIGIAVVLVWGWPTGRLPLEEINS